jgi:hypothetical protein
MYWFCNGADNQMWEITQETNTGATTIVSTFNKKCWDNAGADLGGPLNQWTCDTEPESNTTFYLEYQGEVLNCGGSVKRKVRSVGAAATKITIDLSYYLCVLVGVLRNVSWIGIDIAVHRVS